MTGTMMYSCEFFSRFWIFFHKNLRGLFLFLAVCMDVLIESLFAASLRWNSIVYNFEEESFTNFTFERLYCLTQPWWLKKAFSFYNVLLDRCANLFFLRLCCCLDSLQKNKVIDSRKAEWINNYLATSEKQLSVFGRSVSAKLVVFMLILCYRFWVDTMPEVYNLLIGMLIDSLFLLLIWVNVDDFSSYEKLARIHGKKYLSVGFNPILILLVFLLGPKLAPYLDHTPMDKFLLFSLTGGPYVMANKIFPPKLSPEQAKHSLHADITFLLLACFSPCIYALKYIAPLHEQFAVPVCFGWMTLFFPPAYSKLFMPGFSFISLELVALVASLTSLPLFLWQQFCMDTQKDIHQTFHVKFLKRIIDLPTSDDSRGPIYLQISLYAAFAKYHIKMEPFLLLAWFALAVSDQVVHGCLVVVVLLWAFFVQGPLLIHRGRLHSSDKLASENLHSS